MIGRIRVENRFRARAVFKLEFLEICEFVWQTGIFLKVFGVKALDWYNQIAKRICNEAADLQQGGRSMTSQIWKFSRKNRIFAGAQISKKLARLAVSEDLGTFFRPCRWPG